MDGSERLRIGGALAVALALSGLGALASLGCRGATPQPVTRTDTAQDQKAPAAASTPAPDSAPPAPPAQDEKRQGDAAPVVVDVGAESSETTPATLVEAAHAERQRRAAAGKPVAVINDKTLPRYAAKGQITVADPKAKNGKKELANAAAASAAAAAEAQVRDEQYWRGKARQLREAWRQSADEVKDLEQKSGELRLKFYAESDTFLRDTQVKPEWDRVLDRLRQARLDVDATKQDLTKFLDDGRAAGALPGWLDEGIENEPEEPKKNEKDKDAAPVQAIEPPVLNDDSARTPPPSVGDRR
jgi:hypothetical protein